MNEADQKIDAIKRVLNKRADVLRKYLCNVPKLDGKTRGYYAGKLAAYSNVLKLLDESLDLIRIEL